MKARVDSELCIGCGLCAEICPEVFKMNDETMVADVIVDVVPAEAEDAARDAMDSCPVAAIELDG